ncbi:PREDICTED: uncharacterized protein LOC108783345, partial [Cyphomyrmex costatus]|uniref:uncharacterized protein LOC108783345 n=1 Tax=Cyphomyrmex costatus TaxID=456900 RepID=UPI00085240B8
MEYFKERQLTSEAIQKLCPPSCLHNIIMSLDGMRKEDVQSERIFKEFDTPITMEHLDTAISLANKNSAPGLDRISNNMLDYLLHNYRELLVNLFNSFLQERVIPTEWRSSLVIFIPKAGNSGLRPISLLSCILKLFERIIYWRLVWLIESQSLLPNKQMGFRSSRSCNDSLTFTNQILTAVSSDESFVAVFLDITVAFDNILPSAVLNELKDAGVPATVRKFIENLIVERSVQFLEQGNLGEKRLSYKGTPQDSVLSPLLFNIALCKIGSCMSRNVQFLQYADDIVIFTSHRNPETAVDRIQATLNQISNYVGTKGLSLSPSKSSWMIFATSKAVPAPDCSLSIDNLLIPRVEKVKFLGVILDRKLKGNLHLEYLVKKGRALVNIISTLTAVWWGSHPHCLLTIYRSVFRGAIEYAFSIFTWKNNARIFRQLERLQYRAIRTSMGYRLSTPINVMLCEAREYPLRLRFNLLSERFVIKCMSKRNHPVISSIESLEYGLSTPAQKAQALAKSSSLRCFIINKHDFSHLKSSYLIPAFENALNSLNAFTLRKHFESFISCTKESSDNEIIQSFSSRLQELDPSGLTVYTDGSKLSEDGCAGAAFFSPELGYCFKYKLICSASVFTAEAWAIYQALILTLDAGYFKIYIFSDSRSVLQAISSYRLINGNYIIQKIKQVLLQLEHNNIDCSLFWIPSHKGILGNELANRAAKEACIDGARGFFRTPYSDLQIQAVAKARVRFTDYLNDKANHTGAMTAKPCISNKAAISRRYAYLDISPTPINIAENRALSRYPDVISDSSIYRTMRYYIGYATTSEDSKCKITENLA